MQQILSATVAPLISPKHGCYVNHRVTLVDIVEPVDPSILEIICVLIEVGQNNPKAAADMAHNYGHHHKEDETLKACIQTEYFIYGLNEHLPLFNDFQNANQPQDLDESVELWQPCNTGKVSIISSVQNLRNWEDSKQVDGEPPLKVGQSYLLSIINYLILLIVKRKNKIQDHVNTEDAISGRLDDNPGHGVLFNECYSVWRHKCGEQQHECHQKVPLLLEVVVREYDKIVIVLYISQPLVLNELLRLPLLYFFLLVHGLLPLQRSY
ncbi:hypothetical protein FGO68_gene232 [Halteria grandinella]|uniref:Uncharacterized protein n=1 Tax=Halteria grandinella TaxID=5974 RepID=A0A8J8P1T8_HALGN|nr:hypothetical protein FGO68_gene232 [Halteria grandinella]